MSRRAYAKTRQRYARSRARPRRATARIRGINKLITITRTRDQQGVGSDEEAVAGGTTSEQQPNTISRRARNFNLRRPATFDNFRGGDSRERASLYDKRARESAMSRSANLHARVILSGDISDL